ncbi:GntR family transcriptional regulator [Azohydromonas lata]|uniref:GntR family transcriptional regulator n=1 Tax=Azohydromonas lata TaxID=45677 RepID=A0ABU5IGL0_9BURK|nr:GntR family transcriptional regulator [Azohydromonas lata]MDZ5457671.1 GntR family transcriptional regulator [Azohydromonas lata]
MEPLRLVQPEVGQSRYAALAAALRARIVAGEWPPGTALPAEQTLAAEHGVALGTMRRALELLTEQGFIERRHGRGTFVKPSLSGASLLRFFRFGDGSGQAPASRILSREPLPAPADVARTLGLGPGEPALRLLRLRLVAHQPCLHEEIWLPLPLFAALAEGDPADWGDLLYPLFAQRCGVHVHRAVDSIGFCRLPAEPARALALPADHPCARVQRQAFDLSGRCMELRTTLGDANAFHYTVAIT